MFTDLQREFLRDKVTCLLGQVGMRVEHEKVETDLLRLGCNMSPAGRVRIPKTVIDDLVSSQRKTQRQDEETEKFINNFGIIDWGQFLIWLDKVDEEKQRLKTMVRTSMFDCGPTRYYDYPSGTVLPVNTDIFLMMKKWAHTVPEIGYIANWYRHDAPPETERLESLVMALKTTDKLGGVEAIYPETIKYLQEIGEIMTGRPHESAYLAGSQCVTPTLVFDHRSAEETVERARRKVGRYHIASMITVGLNTPATLPSAVILMAAEILGGMVCAFSQDSEADITGRMLASVMDMRNAQVTYATSDASIVNVGVKQLFDSYFGGHIRVDSFFATVAKKPGLQAVFENFAGAQRTGKLLGRSGLNYPGVGSLDNGALGSPTQAVLDLEILKAQFLPESIAVDEDSVPFEEMCERVDNESSFFDSEHTMLHFRDLRSSSVFRTDDPATGPWKGDEKAILGQCDEIWRQQLKSYTPPDLPEDKIKALDDVVARARKEMLADGVTRDAKSPPIIAG